MLLQSIGWRTPCIFRLDWDRWIMMGLIGFTVGFIGFLLHQLIDVIADFKWERASQYIVVCTRKCFFCSLCYVAQWLC